MKPTPNMWSALVRPELKKKPPPVRRAEKKEEPLPKPVPSRVIPYAYTRRRRTSVPEYFYPKSTTSSLARPTVETGSGEFPASYVPKEWFIVRNSFLPKLKPAPTKPFKLPSHSCVFVFLELAGEPVLYLCQNKDTLEIASGDMSGVVTNYTTALYEQYKDYVHSFCTAMASGTLVKCPYNSGSEFYLSLALQGDSLNDAVPRMLSEEPIVFNRFEVDTNYYRALRDSIRDVRSEEVRLPFEYNVFSLNYFPTPVVVYVHQCPVTNAITVTDSKGGKTYKTQTNDPTRYLEHVFAVCIVLDASLISKVLISTKSKKSNDKAFKGHSYKLLEIVQKDSEDKGDSNGRGTKKRLHVRRGHYMHFPDKKVWRRWSIVGSLSLGSITKDYSVQV